jgi:hypothetical protein
MDKSTPSPHDRHCFVVMPFGRDASEQKWFRGWYEVVLKPAVIEAGFEPKLSAAEEQPGAINDEIRAHLALDPMVVADLGGAEPEDDPNPNVMYELGIRHALGLPLVLMAWRGQRLPFDVSNQRIIVEDRDLVDLESNRRKLIAFIKAAEAGNYYRPMDAVGRTATITAASATLGEDSLLRALTEEIKDLKHAVNHAAKQRVERRQANVTPTIKKLINGKVFRKELYPYFVTIGGDPAAWTQILRTQVDPSKAEAMSAWNTEEWCEHIAQTWSALKDGRELVRPAFQFDEEMLGTASELLPEQPWPQGIHFEVADKLHVKPALASKYIRELIRRGIFQDQVDGKLISDEASNSGEPN